MDYQQVSLASDDANGRVPLTDEDSDDDVQEEVPQNMKCGLWSWRPSWLQPCANMKMFTVTLSLWSLFGSVNYSYFSAVVTQIEREFGLPSSVSGFIKNADNIGFMATVLIFSHFCREANKPRLFAVATVFSSGAIFLFGVPHFIYGLGDRQGFNSNFNLTSKFPSTEKPTEFCDGIYEEDDKQFCNRVSLKTFNMGAMAIFVLSEILQGVAQSPKFPLSMTYMDDNAKDDSPKYFCKYNHDGFISLLAESLSEIILFRLIYIPWFLV